MFNGGWGWFNPSLLVGIPPLWLHWYCCPISNIPASSYSPEYPSESHSCIWSQCLLTSYMWWVNALEYYLLSINKDFGLASTLWCKNFLFFFFYPCPFHHFMVKGKEWAYNNEKDTKLFTPLFPTSTGMKGGIYPTLLCEVPLKKRKGSYASLNSTNTRSTSSILT